MNRVVTLLLTCTAILFPQLPAKITTPKEALGFNLGDDYQMASYTQLESYWKKLASESPRMKLVDMGPTADGRRQYMAIITSPENLKHLARYKEISQKLAHAEALTDDQAHALAREGKAVVWIDGGLHATETVGSQQIMETVYQMVSRTDPETMRFLDDDILLAVLANPDGQEIVSNWYMREKDPLKRSTNGLPMLWHKYIGHDNNRDFFISNMPETTNMNHQLFIEWFPQILYNHHQPGNNATGGVIFMPPFRNPFNFNFDPLIPLDIDALGAAMHSRLVAEGKPGSGMRTFSTYSTWWNGGLRTICYFHNMIGLLTEIIGNPTPTAIPLIPNKQLPNGDLPDPIAPQVWHYRESIDYEITNNRAVLDYASRNRETILYRIYTMGKNSIEKGSRDNWTVTPKRIEALEAAAAPKDEEHPSSARREGSRRAAETPGATAVSSDLYNTVLHDPKFRDPRGYIIPSSQADFPTATKFVDALLKVGITVLKADSQFEVNGKSYPAGSFIVKADQAFRPHVMDMFEPQDHPNDFRYPGGPPIPPYDITGWTLAFQMGVQFDRILDGFNGPFTKINGLLKPPPSSVLTSSANPAGYLVSHRLNDSFVVVNRLLKARCDVYWLNGDASANNQDLGSGAIWVPASATALPILERGAKELGVTAYAQPKAPDTPKLKLKPIRIGLYDQYGGLMPAGWDRWLFEQYEFPFEIVRPQMLDAGDLKSRFDVLVFTDGAFQHGGGGRPQGMQTSQPKPDDIPEQYRSWLGIISEDKTIPQLKKFVEAGGAIVTIGSSTGMAQLLGVPVSDYLTEMGANGKEHHLSGEKFYIPGSLLQVAVDNKNPLAFGMPDKMDVLYDNSPVFKLQPDAEQKQTSPVAWFPNATPLQSGWAWGQHYLNGGTAIAEASVGEGKVILLGPEVTFRGQPHATFKFLFNSVYYGSATPDKAAAPKPGGLQ